MSCYFYTHIAWIMLLWQKQVATTVTVVAAGQPQIGDRSEGLESEAAAVARVVVHFAIKLPFQWWEIDMR